MPWYVETRLLYYRTDLAEEGGVTEAPATWDDLKALAEGIQGAGAEYGINLQPGGTGSWQTFMPFFWQAGGEIMGDERRRSRSTAEPCVEALTFYDSFFEEGLTAPAADGRAARGPVRQRRRWLVHQRPVDDRHRHRCRRRPGDVDRRPSADRRGRHLVRRRQPTWPCWPTRTTRRPAWAFIEYLSQPEVQVTWYETVSDLPSVQSAWDDEALSGDELLVRVRRSAVRCQGAARRSRPGKRSRPRSTPSSSR